MTQFFKIFLTVKVLFVLFCISVGAQNKNNSSADSIIGDYQIEYQGYKSKAKISKAGDGTYTAQIYWVENPINPKTGKIQLDEKNPDKSLRSTPCDKIVVFKGLKYNAQKKVWTDTKIYDPTRGIMANVTICFTDDGRLKLKGSLMGISESVYWKKL